MKFQTTIPIYELYVFELYFYTFSAINVARLQKNYAIYYIDIAESFKLFFFVLHPVWVLRLFLVLAANMAESDCIWLGKKELFYKEFFKILILTPSNGLPSVWILLGYFLQFRKDALIASVIP